MVAKTRSRSCARCISSKRKCDLQHPRCSRCSASGLDCHYPSTRLHSKRTATIALVDEEGREALLTSPSPHEEGLNDIEKAVYAPGSWQILESTTQTCQKEDIENLKASISEVRDWLRRWVDVGSTPFIDLQVYGHDLPASMQDAYMACATYYASNETTRGLALRMMEEKTAGLIGGDNRSSPDLETSAPLIHHLARIQAACIYQVTRLYDGDVRQRSLAEDFIPTLTAWSKTMLEGAVISCLFVNSFSNCQVNTDTVSSWHSWVLAESVRRTWMVVTIIHGVYSMLKGGTVECPGILLFTARKGLWDAKSCHSWMHAQRDGGPLFNTSIDGSDLLEKAKASDVDEFAMWVLRIVVGAGPVEVWVDSSDTQQAFVRR